VKITSFSQPCGDFEQGQEISCWLANGPDLAGFIVRGSVSAETNSVQEGILGGLSLALGIPFPGNGDRRQRRLGSNVCYCAVKPSV
jgi:hypothetical protein